MNVYRAGEVVYNSVIIRESVGEKSSEESSRAWESREAFFLIGVHILAMTATATVSLRKCVIKTLGMTDTFMSVKTLA